MSWIYILKRLVLLVANRLTDDDRSRIVIVYGVLAAVVLVQSAFIKPLDSYTKPIAIICVLELLAFDLFRSSGKASGTIHKFVPKGGSAKSWAIPAVCVLGLLGGGLLIFSFPPDISICERSENGQEIINACTRALTRSTVEEKSIIYTRRGVAYRFNGDLVRAMDDFDHAISLNPNSGVAYAMRSSLHYAKKDFERASSDIEQAINLDYKSPEVFVLRGNLYREQHEDDRAIKDYLEAINLDSKNTTAYNNLGLIYLDRNDYKKAIANFDEAIHLEPKSVVAYNNRAMARKAIGDSQGADADSAKAIEISK